MNRYTLIIKLPNTTVEDHAHIIDTLLKTCPGMSLEVEKHHQKHIKRPNPATRYNKVIPDAVFCAGQSG